MEMSTEGPQQQAPMCVDATNGHHERSHKLKPVPDIDGQRWCRACGKMLPVSAFPTGKRRYLCRQHFQPELEELLVAHGFVNQANQHPVHGDVLYVNTNYQCS